MYLSRPRPEQPLFANSGHCRTPFLHRWLRTHYEKAEQVYREDLGLVPSLSRACQHPDNVWSLHGLHECLRRRGETVEAILIKQRLDLAVARADVPIKASCYCRRQQAA